MRKYKTDPINIAQWLCLLVAACMLLLSAPARAQTDSLDSYKRIAAENNPALRAAYNEYLAALQKVPQAGALPDPTLSFGYFVSPVRTRVGDQQFNIALTQMFPWFGKLNAQERAMADMAKAKYEAFEEMKLRLFYEVTQVYDEYYTLMKSVSISEENLRILRSFLELSRSRFETGRGNLTDALRIEMEIAELENQVKLLKDKQLVMRQRMEQLLNTDLQSPVYFPDTLRSDTLPAITEMEDSLVQNSPRLARLAYEQRSWENQVAVAQKSAMPTISVGVNYINISPRTDMEVPGNGRDALVLPQIGIGIPLYRKKYAAMVKEAELMQEAVRMQQQNVSNELQTMLQDRYTAAIDAQRRIEMYRRLHRLARQSRELLLTQYTTSGRDFEEVLRMQRNELKYALELEKARADLNTAIAYINYLTGK